MPRYLFPLLSLVLPSVCRSMARCTYKITCLYFDATLIPSVRVRQRYIIDIDVITIFRMELAESPRDPTCPNVSQRSPLMQTRNCTCRNSFARSFAPRFLVLIHRIALTLPHRRKFRKRVASVFCFAFLRRVDALRNVTTFVEYLKINRGEWRDILLVKNSKSAKRVLCTDFWRPGCLPTVAISRKIFVALCVPSHLAQISPQRISFRDECEFPRSLVPALFSRLYSVSMSYPRLVFLILLGFSRLSDSPIVSRIGTNDRMKCFR